MAKSENLADVVREVIVETGISRTLIAQDAQLSRATIITWLSGTRTPQPDTASQLADALERRAERIQALVARLRRAIGER